MRIKSGKKNIGKRGRRAIACVLTLCLVTGAAAFAAPVYAASDYSYTSPFNGTSYTHNSKYAGNLIVNGIDTSYWQSEKSDYTSAKAAGVDFAIMRVTYTSYSKNFTLDIDSKFATSFSKARKAGIMTGVYVFSQAKSASEAVKEANFAINRLKTLGIGPEDLNLPVYMDYEFAGPKSGSNKGRLYGLSKSTATEAARAFCTTIRNAGYRPGIYASTSFYNSYIDTSKIENDVDLWCAQYNYRCTYGKKYSTWQYSSTAKINGILSTITGKVGACDVDFMYVDKTPSAGSFDIYGPTEYNYTGKLIKPKFEIYDGDKLLVEGRDYNIGGIRNIETSTGKAYAYIHGLGNYMGYALVPITIGKGYAAHVGLDKCVDSNGELIFGNRIVERVVPIEPEVTDETEESTGAEEDAETPAEEPEEEPAEEIIYEPMYDMDIGMNTYGGYVRNVPSGLTLAEFREALDFYGDAHDSDAYRFEVANSKGSEITDRTVVKTGMILRIYKGSTLLGTADIAVDGNTLNVPATNNLERYKAPTKPIIIKKTSVKRLVRSKKAFSVRVKELKASQADGYQVRYSLKKNMSKAKIKTISTSSSKVSKKITKLKSKRRYYVQVRAYKKINGKTYYSNWSSKKSIKTK